MHRSPLTQSRSTMDLEESEAERIFRSLPLIGALIGNLLRYFRLRPVVEKIERELLNRRRPTLDVWGESVDRALFAQSICELAMLEMGWPNDHFLPTDSAAIVFWNHRDGLDFSTALRDMEMNLDTRIDLKDAAEWFEKTLDEVVDDLWRKAHPDE